MSKKLEVIRDRFNNRLADSEKWSEFYNNHEPDVADLLSLADQYKTALEQILSEKGPRLWKDKHLAPIYREIAIIALDERRE